MFVNRIGYRKQVSFRHTDTCICCKPWIVHKSIRVSRLSKFFDNQLSFGLTQARLRLRWRAVYSELWTGKLCSGSEIEQNWLTEGLYDYDRCSVFTRCFDYINFLFMYQYHLSDLSLQASNRFWFLARVNLCDHGSVSRFCLLSFPKIQFPDQTEFSFPGPWLSAERNHIVLSQLTKLTRKSLTKL